MKKQTYGILVTLVCVLCLAGSLTFAADSTTTKIEKKRIMIVSSYHKEYLWSQGTNDGVCAAFLEDGSLDNKEQVAEFTKNDFVESSKAIVKKAWMDTKRRNSRAEIAEALARIVQQVDQFRPDLLLLGDDNAANLLGNHYLDTKIPIVFWGINGLPLKYGIIDSLKRPGHNVTGVYQKGYHIQCFEYLQKVLPGIKTTAVLSDDSPTGRAHAKRLERYAADGTLPVNIIEIIITNSYEEWQAKALELQPKVDAFYISTHNTLHDKQGNNIDYLEAAAWYFRNIDRPSTTPARFFVEEGFFSTVEDSAFKQGYEAAKIGHKILTLGANPAEIVPYFPAQGPFIVNRKRAKMLGLEEQLKRHKDIIDEYIDTMAALDKQP